MADARDCRTELILHVSGVAGLPGDDSVYGGWSEALELDFSLERAVV